MRYLFPSRACGLLLCAAFLASAAEPEDKAEKQINLAAQIKRYAARSQSERQLAIAELKARAEELRARAAAESSQQRINIRNSKSPGSNSQLTPSQIRQRQKRNSSVRQSQIAEADRQLDELKDHLKPYYPPLFLYEAEVGDIGWTDEKLAVFQIVDDNNVILKYDKDSAADYNMRHYGPPKSFEDKLYWLVAATGGLRDGQLIGIKRVVSVTGTRQYTTILGASKTISVLESPALNPADFMQKSEVRNWKERNGRIIIASFVKLSRGMAVLLGSDGKTVEMKYEDLSDADKDFVRDYQKQIKRP
jgi:hypothetical protein